MRVVHRYRTSRQNWRVIWYAVTIGIFLLGNLRKAQASTPVEVGYRDFQFPNGTGSNSEVTAEKPESKLWWNDGFWWAGMWEKPGDAYHIFKLNIGTQTWIDTGTPIDDRSDTKMDALWDGVRLYVVSHIWIGDAVSAIPAEQGRLYRYSYDSILDTYSLDTGFPVTLGSGKTEALVVGKDTTGTLWITYVQEDSGDHKYKVWVNHSIGGDDTNWGSPYILPVSGANNVTSDEISSLITYNGRVGVMWSNQNTMIMYFAMHTDGGGDLISDWFSVDAFSDSADDHINLKSIQSDSAGSIFAVVKTSKTSELIVVLVCSSGSACTSAEDWSAYPVYTNNDWSPTRPDLLVDTENRHLYVFTRNKDGSGDAGIYFKIADMDNIAFPGGLGVPFIKSSLDTAINDPTSTKQNVNSTTGIVVLGSDHSTHYYLHDYLGLSTSDQPAIYAFSPISGTVGTEVTLTGANLTGTTEVSFNGIPVTITPLVDNDTQVRVIVPVGATSGPVSLTTASGTATSSENFTVLVTGGPLITSFNPTSGIVGTTVTLTGENFTGATGVSFFDGVVDSSFVVDSDTQITAHVPSGASTGRISVTHPSGTGMSASDFSVIVSPSISSFNPNSGPVGTVVTISGSGFTGVTSVSFGGISASSFTIINDNQISAIVPQGAVSGKIAVENEAGVGTSVDNFNLTYTLTIVIQGSGSVILNPPSGVYDNGTEVTLTPVEDYGWIFSNWSGDLTGSDNPGVIQMDGDKTITVNFNQNIVPQYYLTVIPNGNGSIGFDPPGGVYQEGTVVTITATADPGWVFSGWSGDLASSTNPVMVIMDADKDITAHFIEQTTSQYSLSVVASGVGSVVLDPPGGTYDAGTIVELTAIPAVGWVFNGWGGDLNGNKNPENIIMDGNKSVILTFNQFGEVRMLFIPGVINSNPVVSP